MQRFVDSRVPIATTMVGGLLWFFDRPTYARRVLADPRLLAPLPDSARVAERARLAQDTSLTPSLDTTFAYTVGSDGPIGVATHLEMEFMMESGLTATQVLTAATAGGAQLLGLSGELGAITPCGRADLVGLRANPLEDVRNTRDVAWVVKAGHVVGGAIPAR